LAADGYDSLADQTNIYQSKKVYFFIRLLAISPPIPNNVPITIMLGSGNGAVQTPSVLTTQRDENFWVFFPMS
jgi:hypothetical protein